MVTIKGLQALW